MGCFNFLVIETGHSISAFKKQVWLSLIAIFFDSSMLFSLQPRNSPRKLSGFKQSRLWPLKFAENCYRKVSEVAQSSLAFCWISGCKL
jgi:hypothetical protein